MRGNGVPDEEYREEYVVARRVLLNALDALKEHLDSCILVGAQAIYLHTGEADLAVAEFTTDADLAIDPRNLKPEPEIAESMLTAGFLPYMLMGTSSVGIWVSRHAIGGVETAVNVDLLVPKSLSGAGTMSARIPPYEKDVALNVHGLEAALVDNDSREILALEPGDHRSLNILVAGPAALLISKCIKLGERLEATDQGWRNLVKPKDALDILRILRACRVGDLTEALIMLRKDKLAGAVTDEAVTLLPELFGSPEARGSRLAAQAAYPEPADVIAMSCTALANELLSLLDVRKI